MDGRRIRQAASPTPSRRDAAAVSFLAANLQVGMLVVTGLVLVPLYIAKLGANLYGVWLATGDVLAWFGIFDMGVAGIMGQRIAVKFGGNDYGGIAEYLGTALAIQLVMAVCLVGLAFVAAPLIPTIISSSTSDASEIIGAFRLAALGAGLGILVNGVLQFLLALQRARTAGVALVLSQLASAGVTVWLLMAGYGIWALAAAPLARAMLGLVIALPVAIVVLIRDVAVRPRLSRRVFVDFASLASPVFLGMIGNLAGGRSDAVIIAVFSRPEVAVVYVVTRRAADLVHLLLSRIGGAVFTPFAHLVGAGGYSRALSVLRAISMGYWAIGAALITCYIAFNEAFVRLWIGAEYFGGRMLTVVIGLSVLAVGYASLVSYLLGACGQLARNGYLIFAEAVVRVILMCVLFLVVGMMGLPLAAAISSTLLAVTALASMLAQLGAPTRPRASPALWIVIVGLTCIAIGVAQLALWLTWIELITATALMLLTAGVCTRLALRRYAEFADSGVLPLQFRKAIRGVLGRAAPPQ